MKFGINFFPTVGPDEKSGDQYYDEVLDLCVRADRLGFNHVKTVEHYFFAYGGYSPDPVTLLTAVAMRTERLRLVTGAVVPAFNHPVKLAAKLAMLDNISHGRLDVGFARAFLPDEFEAFKVSMEESRPRYEEGIAAVIGLWTQKDFVHEGRFHQFGPVSLLPLTYQKPHPPVYCALTFSPESFRYAGGKGYNVMIVPYVSKRENVQELLRTYKEAWRENGHPEGQHRVQMSYHCYVAEDDDTARREAKEYYADYANKMLLAVEPWATRKTEQYPGYENIVNSIKSKRYEEDLDEGKLFVGSPKKVIKQMEDVVDWYGEVEPSLQINFGNMPQERAVRTVELLGKEVLPYFQTAEERAPVAAG